MNYTTKLAFRLIYASSCISISSAAILRGAQAPTVLTTTGDPMLNAVLQTETYLNTTLNRIDQEMSIMSKQLVAMNSSVRQWRYNHEVLVNSTNHDIKLLDNNTKVLKNVSEEIRGSHIWDKVVELDHHIDYQKNESAEISRALYGITTPGRAHSNVVPRYEKVKIAYDINGTKAESLIHKLRKIESDLLLNETQLVDSVLEHKVDTTAASFPDEFQSQIDEVMKSMKEMKPVGKEPIYEAVSNSSNKSGIMWQAR